MLIHQKYIYGQKNTPKVPNTFIGGVGGVITNETLLAAKLSGVSASDIKLFTVDVNNNISCLIQKKYTTENIIFRVGYWGGGNTLTYYFDTGNFIDVLGSRGFSGQTNIKYSEFNTSVVPSYFYENCSDIRKIRFPNATVLSGQSTFKSTTQLKRCYLANVISATHDLATTSTFPFFNTKVGVKIYVNSLWENDANLAEQYNHAVSYSGAVLVPVTSYVPPNDIYDLTASNITSTSVVLNFTPPTSTNALDFYEVYIDDGTDDPQALYKPAREILSSGSVISGLVSGVQYKIKIRACDEFWNRAQFSNELTIITL